MFIAALFTIAGTQKQHRCPSADEWIRNLWHVNTMEYSSAIKRDARESVLMRWMKIESITQSEVNQGEKDKYYMLTHVYGIQKDGTDDPTGRGAAETCIKNRFLNSAGGEGGMI